jgi:hypothetical protein
MSFDGVVNSGGAMIMKIVGLLLALALSACIVVGQRRTSTPKASTGSICIATITPPNSEEKSLGNPSGGNRYSSYSIQVDKRRPVIAKDKAVTISGLAVGTKHLVKISADGKPMQSFWFRFSEFSTTSLCLWFKDLYETWQLWDAKDFGSKCRCNR